MRLFQKGGYQGKENKNNGKDILLWALFSVSSRSKQGAWGGSTSRFGWWVEDKGAHERVYPNNLGMKKMLPKITETAPWD